MHPTNLLNNFSDTLCNLSGSFTNKETQTSVTNLTYSTPSIQLIARPINCEGKCNVFEHVEVVPDKENPEMVTVIKDTFSEDVIDSSTSEEKTLLKRYNFCREMIVPISKPEKKIVISDEPDLKPNPDSTGSLKGIKKKILANIDPKVEKNCKESKPKCFTKMIEPSCVKRVKCPDCSKKNKCVEKTKCPNGGNISSSENTSNPFPDKNCDENVARENSATSYSDDTESYISKCLSILNKPDSDCKEGVIGVKQPTCPDEKPSYFLMEKNPEPPSNSDDTKTSLFNSCHGTISNITNTVQSFIGTVYQKTKDVVCMVSSESFQQLNIQTRSESCYENYSKENKTDLPPKKSKISTCAFVMRTEEPKTMAAEANSLQTILQPTIETVKKVASTVESVSYVSYLSMEKIITEKVESTFNESSSLDDPTIVQSREVTQTIDPVMNNINNVFEAIKSKIYSIFSDSTADDSDFDEE